MAGGLCSAVFVARCVTSDSLIRERVDDLLEFYRPLGIRSVALSRIPHLSLLAGELRFSRPSTGPSPDPPRSAWVDVEDVFLAWGGPWPAGLEGRSLALAGDGDLRRLDRTVAGFAADRVRARLITGCAGATSLFEARSDGVEAWSTHAVAASHLAFGSARIDPATLPEFFAAEFVGAGRTHISGVRAVPPATTFEFDRSGVHSRSYWPARERFAPLPEEVAYAASEAALLSSLDGKLADAGEIELGLTAGADSRVAAVALRQLGLDFAAFTMAPHVDAPDAEGAARVADALGLAHRVYGHRLIPDADAAASSDAEVRWSEGLAPLTGLGIADGGEPSVILTGNGGETARAWYYRWQARNYRHPTAPQLRRVLGHLHWRIDGATQEAHDQLDRAIAAWIEPAEQAGQSGWRTLDVVYETERLARWGRARLPRASAALAYAFSSPELSRALIALPLHDRTSDGFHRRFLARYAPDLVPAAPAGQRPGIPPVARRLISAARNRRGPRTLAGSPWFWRDVWRERPLNATFIADAALSRELLRSAMGPAWCHGVRSGFRAGERHATEMAFLAAGIGALDRALERLR